MLKTLRNFVYGLSSIVGAALICALILAIVVFGGTLISFLATIVGILLLVCIVAVGIYEACTDKGSPDP
jgi:hypothetical protein|tara:strand:+ start:5031 stop:5237 length:207 start_codon:yes stop_codon:yes gene_type:complete